MDITTKKIISDLRIYEAASVSKDHGRACLKSLEVRGVIKPKRTPTGRCLLSVEDAEILANEF